ncbi:hypothetical protein BO94DRAFT_590017 [Aspergillus sclerotioniger CBS 115572]|uniref:Uncharacterized protein n=1 Tax=Aspergillus sclerotioniger CBS 115572 TaxID=1450535 RepID=A0A317VDR3_9EURO|nr:hypothetical protein BO94DRAFT_590017 [Aspergillus sclerotioniger CBS 115572]PWY71042.1 hypothetical protein BO94DRAFT_590017 [Aspergillus sclerotioniger CBS 115572]
MPTDRSNRYCHFCSRTGHTDSQCFYMTLCHGLYELALMVSHRPGGRLRFNETQTAIQRLVSRRQRNQRRRMRRNERERAQVNRPTGRRPQLGPQIRVGRRHQSRRPYQSSRLHQARRGVQVRNAGGYRPVRTVILPNRPAPSTNGQPNPGTAVPSSTGNNQATPPTQQLLSTQNQEGPRSPHHGSVSSTTIGPVDTDISMTLDEPERPDDQRDASGLSNPDDDLLTFDPLDTAEDEARARAVRGNSVEVVERYCGEIFTMI